MLGCFFAPMTSLAIIWRDTFADRIEYCDLKLRLGIPAFGRLCKPLDGRSGVSWQVSAIRIKLSYVSDSVLNNSGLVFTIRSCHRVCPTSTACFFCQSEPSISHGIVDVCAIAVVITNSQVEHSRRTAVLGRLL